MTSKNKPTVSSAIDDQNDYGPPLDFSFKELSGLKDSLDEEPRIPASRALQKNEDGKYLTACVKFSNNFLTDYSELHACVEKLLPNPAELQWLDLSFNEIKKIDKCILDYPMLVALNLHGNDITDIREVDKLRGLLELRRLTLHGNPIDQEEGYRMYILSTLPNLTSLDFQRVTKQDKAVCHTWKEMSGEKFRKRAEKQARNAAKLQQNLNN